MNGSPVFYLGELDGLEQPSSSSASFVELFLSSARKLLPRRMEG
jgi:hypothetical protein